MPNHDSYTSAWTRAVVWQSEDPELFERITSDNTQKDGRHYVHGGIGSEAADAAYIASLKGDMPACKGTTYGQVLEDDLILHKMALSRRDRCVQLIDGLPVGQP